MRSPFSPFELMLLVVAMTIIVVTIQVGLVSVSFEKLGLSQDSAILLLASSLLGSTVNLPLFTVQSSTPPEDALPEPMRGLLRAQKIPFEGRTLIAVNAGGCLIPLTFSLYLFTHTPLALSTVLLAIALVSTVTYATSRPVPGMGIGMPIFIAPITAALVAVLLDPAHSAPLAYICGTLGVIVGADVLRLRDIRRLGTPVASIGGAGTFDGIFITGIVAVLLA